MGGKLWNGVSAAVLQEGMLFSKYMRVFGIYCNEVVSFSLSGKLISIIPVILSNSWGDLCHAPLPLP